LFSPCWTPRLLFLAVVHGTSRVSPLPRRCKSGRGLNDVLLHMTDITEGLMALPLPSRNGYVACHFPFRSLSAQLVPKNPPE
jgi:hypothetical protein